jgi:pantoate--beta-alanine ligase
MGALHAGHMALVAEGKRRADHVVASIFVNPAQFGAGEDLSTYPRREGTDAAMLKAEGVKLLWAPDAATMYPQGHATSISVSGVSGGLDGAARPGHFDGVAIVVAKLLNQVAPDVALFGEKDFQQLAVIRRLVADLDVPVRIEAVPTVRDHDGLALSSRNVHLRGDDRERAVALHRALGAAEDAIARGERQAPAIRDAALAAMTGLGVEPEYLELVSPETFEPVTTVNGRVLVAVAARVGGTRLIDNALITTTDGGAGRGAAT